MSAITTPATAWQWPADVLTFAAEHGVTVYLDPLLAATREVFPTADSLACFLQTDPEIPGHRYVVFAVRVPQTDIPDYVAAQYRWIGELDRSCPSDKATLFVLRLIPVSA